MFWLNNRTPAESVVVRALTLSLAIGLCFLGTTQSGYAQADTIQTNVPALKTVFVHDFTIGCLLSYPHIGFSTDPPVAGQSTVIAPNGGKLVQFHMNSMGPGNNMKPMYTVDIAGTAGAYAIASNPQIRDSIEVHPILKFNGNLIAQLNWAQRQGFRFRGHTLVWHSQTPAELFRSGYASSGPRLSKATMTARLENYIKEIVRLIHESWPGMLSAIDVVNEAVNDNGTDRTTDSEWYLTFGDNTYIMKAFEYARKYTQQYGETQIKLYYNDYNTTTPTKADGIVRVVGPIFHAGYLDGLGMQEHDANTAPTAAAWVTTYNKFDTVCTEMSVTELDVTTGSATPSAATLATQANQYGQLFKCFVERSYYSGRGKIINVSKDGLNDQYTFKTNQSSSLWDALNKCKPAFYAVAHVGLSYNGLDSLIAHADSLHQQDYTPGSWSNFVPVLAAARSARDQNYSATVSADTSLGLALNNLKSAMNALAVTGVDDRNTVVTDFALRQNYPNPFNPSTRITFSLGGNVGTLHATSLQVFDLLGRVVAVLVNERKNPGRFEVTWDASGLPSGVYICRMTTGGFSASRKMILTK